jgi:hypothetical protein
MFVIRTLGCTTGLAVTASTASAPRRSRFKEVIVGLALIPRLFKSEQFFQRSERYSVRIGSTNAACMYLKKNRSQFLSPF